MASKDKPLCPIRLFEDEYEKIKEKCKNDTISYQKLMELLSKAYLKDDPNIRNVVDKYLSDRKQNKNNILNEDEVDDIYRLLEKNSPLTQIEKEKLNEQKPTSSKSNNS